MKHPIYHTYRVYLDDAPHSTLDARTINDAKRKASFEAAYELSNKIVIHLLDGDMEVKVSTKGKSKNGLWNKWKDEKLPQEFIDMLNEDKWYE